MKRQRKFPAHRKWIATRICILAGNFHASPCLGDVVPAHVRTGTDGGTSLKPSDQWVLPLCDKHHREQHQVGERAFERKYGIDMKAIARAFAAQSPDQKMRASKGET